MGHGDFTVSNRARILDCRYSRGPLGRGVLEGGNIERQRSLLQHSTESDGAPNEMKTIKSNPSKSSATSKLQPWAMLMFVILAVAVPANAAEVIDIGSRLELFVDHYLIDHLDGSSLELQEPRPGGVAIEFNEPWEGTGAFIPVVIRGPEKYHMYYRGFAKYQKGDPFVVENQCYAESEDGIHWTKPNLGRIEIQWPDRFNLKPTRDNNALFKGQGFIPFWDTRPGIPTSERFKALRAPPRLEVEIGVRAYVSANGLDWKLMRQEAVYAGDRLTMPFWSESEQCYVQIARINDERAGSNIRSLGRSVSPDLFQWTDFEYLDFRDAPPTRKEQFYSCGATAYFRAPHIYLILVARFMPGRQALTDAEVEAAEFPPRSWRDCSDTVLMTSRGNNKIDRTFKEAFIRPGMGPKNWVTRTNYPGRGIVPTGPAEISIYVNRHYGQISNHIERLTLRTDGFVSVNAPYAGGEMLTKLLKFSGRELVLNFATGAAGSIRVEIQDQEGKPIPGFALEDCPEIIGDQIERVVEWRTGSDVGRLAGTPVGLRFVMKEADLYSIQFQ